MSEQDIEQIINIINKDINQSINKNLITYFKKVDYNISLLTAIKSVLFRTINSFNMYLDFCCFYFRH